ncbi:hypothetical protein NN561_012986 [Cricetulus griseus]
MRRGRRERGGAAGEGDRKEQSERSAVRGADLRVASREGSTEHTRAGPAEVPRVSHASVRCRWRPPGGTPGPWESLPAPNTVLAHRGAFGLERGSWSRPGTQDPMCLCVESSQ